MSTQTTPEWLLPYMPVCEAIAALLHPYGEVVVHDIATDRIIAIWNPYSNRKPGDPSWLEELSGMETTRGMIGPYAKIGEQGQHLTAVSAILADAGGESRGLLCVNFDRTPLDGVAELMSRFAAPAVERPSQLFDSDWREQIALVVDEECRQRGLRRDGLRREGRIALVRALDERGLFSTRHAVSHAARILGVSRATVYQMLKEVRS
jgi:predicted transcriptional regulator YheO